jgi:hypothetical protein
MSFLKNLFGKKEKAAVEPMRGGPVIQTQAEQDATRGRMESEMAGQRTKRDEAAHAPASDETPGAAH